MPRKIILDVDPGTDDALALSLALSDPSLDVVAVTAVGGERPRGDGNPQRPGDRGDRANRSAETPANRAPLSDPDEGLPVDGRNFARSRRVREGRVSRSPKLRTPSIRPRN